jgi:hypothetical protein
MVSLQDIESKVADAIHSVISEAAANEPAIDAAARDALLAVGAPDVVATGLQSLIGALLGHFTAEQAAKAAPPETPQEG